MINDNVNDTQKKFFVYSEPRLGVLQSTVVTQEKNVLINEIYEKLLTGYNNKDVKLISDSLSSLAYQIFFLRDKFLLSRITNLLIVLANINESFQHLAINVMAQLSLFNDELINNTLVNNSSINFYISNTRRTDNDSVSISTHLMILNFFNCFEPYKEILCREISFPFLFDLCRRTKTDTVVVITLRLLFYFTHKFKIEYNVDEVVRFLIFLRDGGYMEKRLKYEYNYVCFIKEIIDVLHVLISLNNKIVLYLYEAEIYLHIMNFYVNENLDEDLFTEECREDQYIIASIVNLLNHSVVSSESYPFTEGLTVSMQLLHFLGTYTSKFLFIAVHIDKQYLEPVFKMIIKIVEVSSQVNKKSLFYSVVKRAFELTYSNNELAIKLASAKFILKIARVYDCIELLNILRRECQLFEAIYDILSWNHPKLRRLAIDFLIYVLNRTKNEIEYSMIIKELSTDVFRQQLIEALSEEDNVETKAQIDYLLNNLFYENTSQSA